MSSLGFSNKFVIEAKGIAKGLFLMWKAGINIDVIDFYKDLIAMNIHDSVCIWHFFLGFMVLLT